MPDHGFFFEMDLSSGSGLEGMVTGLGQSVLSHFGYPAAATTEILAALQTQWESGAPDGAGRCHVLFRAGAGELQIAVTHAGGRRWRISRPLP